MLFSSAFDFHCFSRTLRYLIWPACTLSTDSAQFSAPKFELLDPDVRLMLQVREGNASAFEALVLKYQNRLITVLQHLVNDRSLAEDLAQEVFLRIYRARKTYVPTAKFSTWVYTITNNVANNAIRKSSRRREVNLLSSPSGTMRTRPLDTMAKEKSALMPTRQLDQREMSKILHDSIQSLSPRQRMAMMLSRFENLSYIEIAAAMQLSTQAVKSLLSRARVNLKEMLEPYLESGNLPHVDSDSSHSKTDED
jgi:RNA polymerase sigma-70 factor, ECF subfamily